MFKYFLFIVPLIFYFSVYSKTSGTITNPIAQFSLGMTYSEGDGVSKNEKKSNLLA